MAGAAPLEAGGAKEADEEKKKKEKKRGRSSDSRHVILAAHFLSGTVESFFAPGCSSKPDPAFSADLDPAFTPDLYPEQSFGSLFTKSGYKDFAESGPSLLLNTVRIR